MSSTKERDITGYFLRNQSAPNNADTSEKTDKTNESGDHEHHVISMSTNSNTTSGDQRGDTAMQAPVSNAELKSLILRMEQNLTQRLDRLESDMKSMKDDQTRMDEHMGGLEHDMANAKSNIQNIEQKTIPELDKKMEGGLQQLHEKILKMEIHDRRMNLLFYGVAETPNENLTEVLHNMFTQYVYG